VSDALNRLLADGLEHYLNGRLRDAAGVWQEVLRLDPANARAREYLRSALSAHGPLRPGRELTPPPARPAPFPERTAWDEGPSLATSMNLDSRGLDLDLVEDGRQPEPLPFYAADAELPESEQNEVSTLLRGARELYALNDFSGALELLDLIREKAPNNPSAERMREDCVETLIQMYESQLGPLSGVPGLAVNPDEIIWLNLDHRAGFVLAQIDGGVSYDDLHAICGMSRLDTSKILAQLLQEKVIRKLR
jgi:tetratricopeptide (TPR) repeat protein